MVRGCKSMKKILVFFFLFSFNVSSEDVSATKCEGPKNTWNNCLVTYANGDRYWGEFLNGERNGYGAYNWKSGEITSGTWKFGSRHGYFRFKNAKGEVSWDYWLEDKKVTRDEFYEWKYPSLKSKSKSVKKTEDIFDFGNLDQSERTFWILLILFFAPIFIFGFLTIRERKKITFDNFNKLKEIDHLAENNIDNQTTQENTSEETNDSLIGEEPPFEFQNENTMDSSDGRDQKHSDLKTFFGLSLKGWSFTFVIAAVAFEVSGELYSLSQGYSLFSIKKPRFNVMETQHALLYWAGVLGAIYLVVDYLKPNPPTFKSVDSGNDLGTSDENQQTDDIQKKENTLEDRLSSLKELFDKGLISKEVYESKQLDILEDE